MSRTLTLYTKPNCPLCDDAEQVILRGIRGHRIRFEKVDISHDPDLLARYGHCIPVVAVDGDPLFFGKVSTFRLQQVLIGKGLSERYKDFLRRFTL